MKKSIRSGSWITVGNIFQRSVSFLSFPILARILAPEDFGVMAIALMAPIFLQAFTDVGFNITAIHRKGAIEKYLDAMWSLGLFRSVIIAAIIYVLAPTLATFFHVPEAVTVIRLSGLLVLISSLNNIGEIYFQKNLEYKFVFFRDAAREIAYVAVAITLAFYYRSYWALFIATAVSYVIQAIATYILHPYRPRLTIRWKHLRDFVDYSKWVVGQLWIGQIYRLAEKVIVARFTNVSSTGLYTKAKSSAGALTNLLSAPINTVSFSAYSKLQDKKEKVRIGVINSFHIIHTALIPLAFLIFGAAGNIILIVLGEQWLPMTNMFRLLFLYYFFDLFIMLSYNVLNGIGLPNRQVMLESTRLTLTVILLLFLTTNYGALGAALAMVIASAPIYVVAIGQLRKDLGFSFTDVWRTMTIPLVATLAISLPFLAFQDYILTFSSLIFLFLVGAAGLLYAAIIMYVGIRFQIGPHKIWKLLISHLKP